MTTSFWKPTTPLLKIDYCALKELIFISSMIFY
jgi:hypothetical protein